MARKAIIDYDDLTDDQLVTKAEHVFDNMTGNANFPTPPVPLSTFNTTKAQFKILLEEVQDGAKKFQTIDKDNKRTELLGQMRDNAEYVNITAGDNESKIATSGYTLEDATSPVGVFPVAALFTVLTKDIEGQIEVKQTFQPKGKIYVYLYSLDDPPPANDDDWNKLTSTKSRFVIDGLPEGAKVWVKAGCKATDPKINFTQPKKRYVQ